MAGNRPIFEPIKKVVIFLIIFHYTFFHLCLSIDCRFMCSQVLRLTNSSITVSVQAFDGDGFCMLLLWAYDIRLCLVAPRIFIFFLYTGFINSCGVFFARNK